MISRWKQKFAAKTLENILQNFPGVDQTEQQSMCLMEEIGELTGELRRHLGWARRPGNPAALAAELADVQIVSWVAAEAMKFDLYEETKYYIYDLPFMGWRFVTADLFYQAYRISNGYIDSLVRVVRITETIARELEIDLNKEMADKWDKIFSRGWKEGDRK